MTLNLPAKTPNTSLDVFAAEFEGESGYWFNILGSHVAVFLKDKDADKLARFMLFKEPGTDTQPIDV